MRTLATRPALRPHRPNHALRSYWSDHSLWSLRSNHSLWSLLALRTGRANIALRSHQRPVSTEDFRDECGIDTHVVVARHERAAALGHHVVLTVQRRGVPRTAERESQTGRSDRAGWPLRAGVTCVAAIAFVASLTSRAGVALITLLTCDALSASLAFRPRCALRAYSADRSLWACIAFCSRGALRTGRADRSLRACIAFRSGGALRTGGADWSLRADFPFLSCRSAWPGRARRSHRSLRSQRPVEPRCSDRPLRSLGTHAVDLNEGLVVRVTIEHAAGVARHLSPTASWRVDAVPRCGRTADRGGRLRGAPRVDDPPVAAQRVIASGHRLGGAQLGQAVLILISIVVLAVSVDR